MKPYLKILLTSLFTTILLLGFALPINMVGNWYQQFMPNMGNKQITDMTFLDSLTGYAVATQTSDSSYILKTTTSGDNWQIIHRQLFAMTHVQFLNASTGYAGGGYLYKTINGGFNWTQINTPASTVEKMFVLNDSTIWFVNSDGLTGGVFFTSNGGGSWVRQFDNTPNNPAHIYMFNARIGFVDGGGLNKTTNGGTNWSPIPGAGNFLDMFFIDSLNGYKSNLDIKRTNNGGLNWTTQTLPTGGNIAISQIERFDNTSIDTIWGVGGFYITTLGFRGIIYRTTNGGSNWLFQVPDSNINIGRYSFICSTGKHHIWAYSTIPTGIHTTNGGDPIWLTGIKQISSEIPKEFKLYQNFPNPFNPRTIIKYAIQKSGYVQISVYDITGKEIQKLVDQKQEAGIYEVDFAGKFLSSGVYFYKLIVDNKIIDTKKMILLK